MWTDLEKDLGDMPISDLLVLDREGLIAAILQYNDECFFDFSGEYLKTLSDRQLRRTLFTVRRHYRNKGY